MRLRTDTQHGDYAGFVSRGFAFGVDAVIIAVAVASTSWLMTAVLNSLLVDPLDCPEIRGWADLRAILCHYASVPAPFAALLLPVAYRVFFWWTASKTPGMAVMGLQLVRLNGKPMTLMTAIRRLLGYGASLFLAGLGFFAILVTDKRQGWHDMLAGTAVLYAWPAREDVALSRALARTRLVSHQPGDAVSRPTRAPQEESSSPAADIAE